MKQITTIEDSSLAEFQKLSSKYSPDYLKYYKIIEEMKAKLIALTDSVNQLAITECSEKLNELINIFERLYKRLITVSSENIPSIVNPVSIQFWQFKYSLMSMQDILLGKRPETIKTYESSVTINDLPKDILKLVMSNTSNSPLKISKFRRVSSLWRAPTV